MRVRRVVFAIAGLLLAVTTTTSAPADQYFGRLKMSALRVRYETMQLRKRYETHQLLPEETVHLLLLTEDALCRWASAYPKDPWLASTGFAMANVYAELPGALARQHAVALFVYVKTHFPATGYASSSRTALHRGVPQRADPVWAQAMRATPVPSPSTAPSVMPSAMPSAASPAPGSSPPPQ
jgi:hypothetical protein